MELSQAYGLRRGIGYLPKLKSLDKIARKAGLRGGARCEKQFTLNSRMTFYRDTCCLNSVLDLRMYIHPFIWYLLAHPTHRFHHTSYRSFATSNEKDSQ